MAKKYASIMIILIALISFSLPCYAVDLLGLASLTTENILGGIGLAVDFNNSTAYQGAEYSRRNYYDTLTAMTRGGAFSSGNTRNYAVVNTNNHTINYNDTTNNFVTKNYTDIYYNDTYNTYYTQIDNYNYYITYAPTYTSVTYIQSGSNNLSDCTTLYNFFELPDGRNSYYLTATDIMGQVFNYEVYNYDEVAEDEHQLALFHFDGDTRDSSFSGSSITWNDGVCTTYLDSGSFDRCLYLNSDSHNFDINLPSTIGNGDYSVEFRAYQVPNIINSHSVSLYKAQYIDYYYYRYRESWDQTGYYRYCWLDSPSSNSTYVLVDSLTLPSNSIVTPLSFQYCPYEVNSIVPYSDFSFNVPITNGSGSYSIINSNNVASSTKFRLVVNDSFGIYSGLNRVFGTNYLLSYSFASETYPNIQFSTFPDIFTTSNVGSDTYISGSMRSYALESSNFGIYTGSSFSSVPVGEWVTYSLVREDGILSTYVNGLIVSSKADNTFISDTLTLDFGTTSMQYSYLDELRITDYAVHSSNSYTPSSMPYDSSSVLVVPSSGSSDDIAIKSNISVNKVRIGGVRFTYPSRGDTYIYLNGNNEVGSIQQYNGADWASVDASIYSSSAWVDLSGYDFSEEVIKSSDYPDNGFGAEIIEPSDPSGSDEPSGGGPGGSGGSGTVLESIGDFFASIGNFLGTVINGIVSLFDRIITGVTTLFTTLSEAIENFSGVGGGFVDFLTSAMPFVPEEIWNLLILSIGVSVVLLIIKLIRG